MDDGRRVAYVRLEPYLWKTPMKFAANSNNRDVLQFL